MKNILYSLLLIFLASCSNNDKFIIGKGKVGDLNKKTRINDLESVFKNDSLVIILAKREIDGHQKFLNADDEYQVFEKGGKKLLSITPIASNDSLSKLKSIEVFDNRFITKKGISLYSPYKDINATYNISIINTLSSAHIDIDEINATMQIKKEEIGIDKSNRNKIRKDMIPDLAKIEHFTIWFN
jgi:hypothetical protein